MHVAVASTGNTLLEDALLAAGHQVSLLVPADTAEQRRAQAPGLAVYPVKRWNSFRALLGTSLGLPGTFDQIATIDEQAVVACAYLRQLQKLPGLTVADARAHTDKHRMKKRLREAGLPVADHVLVRHSSQVQAAGEHLGWPVVVKPRRAAGTVNTFVVTSPAHLLRLTADGRFDRRVPDDTGRFGAGEFLLSLNEGPGFMVERYLAVRRELFADLYLHEGELVAAYPGYYSSPLLETLGHHQWDTVIPAEDPDGAAAVALALEATKALGSGTGVAHCEILETDEGLVVGEVAHRPGGGGIWRLYARQHGLDVPAALAALAVGQRPHMPVRSGAPVLSNLVLNPPPGIVRSIASAEELAALPMVQETNLHLEPGSHVPGGFGTLSLAGHIAFASSATVEVDHDAQTILEALALEVTAPSKPAAGCVR